LSGSGSNSQIKFCGGLDISMSLYSVSYQSCKIFVILPVVFLLLPVASTKFFGLLRDAAKLNIWTQSGL
jgi:hypothetical protein